MPDQPSPETINSIVHGYNSDGDAYWGSNQGNMGGAQSFPDDWAESGHAIWITLPPLAILMLKPDPHHLPHRVSRLNPRLNRTKRPRQRQLERGLQNE